MNDESLLSEVGADEPLDANAPESPATPPPTLYLTGDNLDAFGLHDCKPGDEYTATVTFRVAGAREPSEGEASKDIEITGMTDVTPSGGAGVPGEEPIPTGEEDGALPEAPPTDGEDAESKMLGYNRPRERGPGLPVDMKKIRGGAR